MLVVLVAGGTGAVVGLFIILLIFFRSHDPIKPTLLLSIFFSGHNAHLHNHTGSAKPQQDLGLHFR